jgi:two-component system sensor histidine kinase RcsD
LPRPRCQYALRRTLVLLIQYSITTTPIGKITLDVCQEESASDT